MPRSRPVLLQALPEAEPAGTPRAMALPAPLPGAFGAKKAGCGLQYAAVLLGEGF